MKKIVAIFVFFVFFRSVSLAQAVSTDFIKRMVERIDTIQLEKTSVIFSDSSYSKPTHNFSSGQTVYIRVENVGNGDKKKKILLLDSAKKEISTITLSQSGSGPYLFTTSFKAPNEAGIYYVDIKIDSGSGSVYSSQQNINVGEQQGSVRGTSTITGQQITPTPKPSARPTVISPKVTEIPTAKETRPLNFVTRFFNFLKKFLSGLTF